MAAVDTLANSLSSFQAAELIRRVQIEPELEYLFKHILTQEAIYDSLLKSARSELHGRVAAAIERLAVGQEEERKAILALHYERAGLYQKAFDCALAAGDRARRVYAHREALDLYDRALAAARSLGDPRLAGRVLQVYIGRGTVFQVIGDHSSAASNFREMFAAATAAGDLAMQAEALTHLATVQIVSGGAPDLAQNLDQALALARQAGVPILIGRALWSQGLALRFHDPEKAIGLWRQALELAQGVDAPEARELAASVLIDLRVGVIIAGRIRESLAYARQAESAFRALGNLPMVADALGGVALICSFQGDVATTRSAGEEGLRISREIGNPWGVLYNGWGVLESEMDAGRCEEILSLTQARMADAIAVRFPVFVGLVRMQTARAYRELGVCDQARAWAEESMVAYEDTGAATWSTWGRGATGRVLIACGDLARAHALLDDLWWPGADTTARMQGLMGAGPAIAELALADYHRAQDEARRDFGLQFCEWYLNHFEAEEAWRMTGEMRYLRGRLHLARRDLAAAEADLLQARTRLAAAEAPILVWLVDAALAEVYGALKEDVRAMEAHDRAVEQIHRLAAGVSDPALRRSFLERPDVQVVLA